MGECAGWLPHTSESAADMPRVGMCSQEGRLRRRLTRDACRERGITVTEQVPLVVGVGSFNEDYLEAKRDRMGHILPDDDILDDAVVAGQSAATARANSAAQFIVAAHARAAAVAVSARLAAGSGMPRVTDAGAGCADRHAPAAAGAAACRGGQRQQRQAAVAPAACNWSSYADTISNSIYVIPEKASCTLCAATAVT